jgi:hypothetical protein
VKPSSGSKSDAPSKKPEPYRGPLSRSQVTGTRILVFVILLVSVSGAYIFLSGFLRHVLLTRIAQAVVDQAMNAEVEEVGGISLSPDGALLLIRPRIVTKHGSETLTLVEAESVKFTLNGDARWILEHGSTGLADIRMLRVDIERPKVFFARGPDEVWNIDLAFRPKPKPAPAPTPAPAPETPSKPAPPPPRPPPDYFPPQGIHVHQCSLHVQFHNPQNFLQWKMDDLNFIIRKSAKGQLLINNPDGGEDLEARFYGGRIVLWLNVLGFVPGLEAEVRVQVKEALLQELTRDCKLPRPVSGKLSVYVSLARNFAETEGRLTGAGEAWIKDGDLYEYPMLVSAITVLNLSGPGTNRIHSAKLAFKVLKYKIEISEMNFYSDSMSLFGDGVCDLFGQHMDVVLVPRLNGMLNPFNLALSALATAHLEGPVTSPTARVTPFASYKETEHRIIEEAIKREQK